MNLSYSRTKLTFGAALQVGELAGSPLGMGDVAISTRSSASSRCACTCGFKKGKYYDAFKKVYYASEGFAVKHYS